jgi:hypothetical protein
VICRRNESNYSEGRRNEDGRGRLKSPLLRLPSSFLRPHQSVYGYKIMSHKLHKVWLRVTATIVGSFGPVFFLGTMTNTSEPARWTLHFLSWSFDGGQIYASPDIRFLSALTGGFLLGWGVMIGCLSIWTYDLAPEAVRKSVLSGLLAWFFLDSAGSIASGTPSNAIIDVFVLLMAVGPLWQPIRE